MQEDPLPARRPSAMVTLVVLLIPAALCYVLGVASSTSSSGEVAALILGIAILGSLGAGIWSGFRLTDRFVSRPNHRAAALVGFILLSTAVSSITCFGGCLAGLLSHGIH